MSKRLTNKQMLALYQSIADKSIEAGTGSIEDFEDENWGMIFFEALDYAFRGSVLEQHEFIPDNEGEAYTVFDWEGTTYKADFSYRSYAGYNFDHLTIHEVKKVTKTVTVWE